MLINKYECEDEEREKNLSSQWQLMAISNCFPFFNVQTRNSPAMCGDDEEIDDN